MRRLDSNGWDSLGFCWLEQQEHSFIAIDDRRPRWRIKAEASDQSSVRGYSYDYDS